MVGRLRPERSTICPVLRGRPTSRRDLEEGECSAGELGGGLRADAVGAVEGQADPALGLAVDGVGQAAQPHLSKMCAPVPRCSCSNRRTRTWACGKRSCGRAWRTDKSALVRLGTSPDADEWANLIGRGLVGISTVTLLEAGFFARSALALARAMGLPPLASMPVEYLTPRLRTGPWKCNVSSRSADSIAPRRSPIC